MDPWIAIDTERAALAHDLAQISEAQWDAPSLCGEWKVRDVVAHILDGTHFTLGEFVRVTRRHGLGFNSMRASLAREGGARPPAELLADLRDAVGVRTKPPWARPVDMLSETLVHAQDIRRPLGVVHSYPAETTIAVANRLKRIGFPFGAKKRIAGLHLVANDADWSYGDGLDVTGPMEAFVVMMAGRRSADADLSGPGLTTLTSRP
jgi:uncharacterized protein (TIGR03083 family)